LLLKGNSTALIDIFSFPTLQLSLEKEVVKNLSFSTEFGYQIYSARKVDTAFIHPKGLKANIEIRLYNLFGKQQTDKGIRYTDLEGSYLGLNLFYRTNKYTTGIPYSKLSDTLHYNDCFVVDKKNRGVNIIWGYQQSFSRGLLIDFYVGLGLMKIQLKNSHREITNEDTLSGTDLVPLFYSWNLSENSGWRANPNLGVRVGIKIW
jgi:hypothetical protein